MNERETPCQQINLLGVGVWVKRDDLNHPVVQGNKLRKLKHNLKQAQQLGKKTLVTFGGAYSNHLLATAYAAQQAGFKSLGVVRGAELASQQSRWSETLYRCHQLGMVLKFVSRADYRLKEDSSEVREILAQTEQAFLIPEGGSNGWAVAGMAEIVAELSEQVPTPTHLICPVGTGGTLAGLILGVAQQAWRCQVIGVAVLKGLHGVKDDINQWLGDRSSQVDWRINHDYHCGGYAKSTPELARFAVTFAQQHGFELDKVYNSKSFYALAGLISQGVISPGDRPLIIHTGGLQGGTFV